MNKEAFKQLFYATLEEAAINAEERLNHKVSRNFLIQLHGAGSKMVVVEPQDALPLIYLNDEQYYRVIDVSVIKVDPTVTYCFMRISGHTPSGFNETWNDPLGHGPFRQLIAQQIKDDTL